MNIYIGFVLALGVLFGAIQATSFFNSPAKMEARWQIAEAQKYKTFTQAVNDYVAANPT